MARKQSKTSWRKRGAPLEDAALERRRLSNQDRRTGGALSQLDDAQLFTISASADAAAPRASKRRKLLHVERVVAPNPNISTVAPPPTPRATPRLPPPLRAKLRKLRAAPPPPPHALPPPPSPPTDLWSAPAAAPPPRRRPRAPEASTRAAAVVVAPGGASYNPEEAARQAVVEAAVAHEMARRRRERMGRSAAFTHAADSEEEAEGEPPPRVELPADRTPRDHTLMGGEVDMRGEEGEEGEEGEGGEEGGEEGGGAPPRRVAKEPLTAAQRNRRKLARERAKAAAEAAAARKAARQLGREAALLAEIRKASAALEEKRRAAAAREATRTKKLGKLKYEPPRPAVLLSDELPAALRQLPAADGEASLLADRFDAMQARNLIEVRRPQQKKPAKRGFKQVTRESCKDVRYSSPHFKGELPAWL